MIPTVTWSFSRCSTLCETPSTPLRGGLSVVQQRSAQVLHLRLSHTGLISPRILWSLLLTLALGVSGGFQVRAVVDSQSTSQQLRLLGVSPSTGTLRERDMA